MNIEHQIAAWDAKSANEMKLIFKDNRDEPGFADRLLELLEVNNLQKGASWLLKAWLAEGERLNKKQTHALAATLDILEHWETRLHILQCLPHLEIGKNEKKTIERFLREALMHSNKFVRAWAYGGFYFLARQHPGLMVEAKQLMTHALQNEAASVKARIRNILKKP